MNHSMITQIQKDAKITAIEQLTGVKGLSREHLKDKPAFLEGGYVHIPKKLRRFKTSARMMPAVFSCYDEVKQGYSRVGILCRKTGDWNETCCLHLEALHKYQMTVGEDGNHATKGTIVHMLKADRKMLAKDKNHLQNLIRQGIELYESYGELNENQGVSSFAV